jgi:hypothetical protein
VPDESDAPHRKIRHCTALLGRGQQDAENFFSQFHTAVADQLYSRLPQPVVSALHGCSLLTEQTLHCTSCKYSGKRDPQEGHHITVAIPVSSFSVVLCVELFLFVVCAVMIAACGDLGRMCGRGRRQRELVSVLG